MISMFHWTERPIAWDILYSMKILRWKRWVMEFLWSWNKLKKSLNLVNIQREVGWKFNLHVGSHLNLLNFVCTYKVSGILIHVTLCVNIKVHPARLCMLTLSPDICPLISESSLFCVPFQRKASANICFSKDMINLYLFKLCQIFPNLTDEHLNSQRRISHPIFLVNDNFIATF